MSVKERKVLLPSLSPAALKVKVQIYTLLIFVGNGLWLVCALEPCKILLMESPGLFLQFLRSKVLHVSALAVVKDVEQSINIELGEQ